MFRSKFFSFRTKSAIKVIFVGRKSLEYSREVAVVTGKDEHLNRDERVFIFAISLLHTCFRVGTAKKKANLLPVLLRKQLGTYYFEDPPYVSFVFLGIFLCFFAYFLYFFFIFFTFLLYLLNFLQLLHTV